MQVLVQRINQIIIQLEILVDSSFNVNRNAIKNQLVAYKNVLKEIENLGGVNETKE